MKIHTAQYTIYRHEFNRAIHEEINSCFTSHEHAEFSSKPRQTQVGILLIKKALCALSSPTEHRMREIHWELSYGNDLYPYLAAMYDCSGVKLDYVKPGYFVSMSHSSVCVTGLAVYQELS